jgi:hypothetical protein
MNKKLILYFLLSASMSKIYSKHHDNTATDPNYTYKLHFVTKFLKPCSDLNFATEAYPLPPLSPKWKTFSLNPGYNFAFDLGCNIVLHEKNTVLMGNWDHFLSPNQYGYTQMDLATNMIGPFFEIGPEANFYSQALSCANFTHDALRVDYGQFILMHNNLSTNIFAGINYTRITQQLQTSYQGTDLTEVRNIIKQNSFHGVGPEIGFDLLYKIHKGLHFKMISILGCLTGTPTNETQFASYSQEALESFDLAQPNIQTIQTNSNLEIIPSLSQKIGIGYDLLFRDHCEFHVEFGYQTNIYINALSTINLASQVPQPPLDAPGEAGVYARTLQNEVHNFSLGGPYCTISIGF